MDQPVRAIIAEARERLRILKNDIIHFVRGREKNYHRDKLLEASQDEELNALYTVLNALVEDLVMEGHPIPFHDGQTYRVYAGKVERWHANGHWTPGYMLPIQLTNYIMENYSIKELATVMAVASRDLDATDLDGYDRVFDELGLGDIPSDEFSGDS